MVDTTDLKSVDQLVVRVQVPLPPIVTMSNYDKIKNKALMQFAKILKYTFSSQW